MSISRLAGVAVLTEEHCQVLSRMLADALDLRYPGACSDCDESGDGLCEVHAADLLETDAYIEFGRQFGVEAAQ